jgi:hypothetical protein
MDYKAIDADKDSVRKIGIDRVWVEALGVDIVGLDGHLDLENLGMSWHLDRANLRREACQTRLFEMQIFGNENMGCWRILQSKILHCSWMKISAIHSLFEVSGAIAHLAVYRKASRSLHFLQARRDRIYQRQRYCEPWQFLWMNIQCLRIKLLWKACTIRF